VAETIANHHFFSLPEMPRCVCSRSFQRARGRANVGMQSDLRYAVCISRLYWYETHIAHGKQELKQLKEEISAD
jgi:hypothetical protein